MSKYKYRVRFLEFNSCREFDNQKYIIIYPPQSSSTSVQVDMTNSISTDPKFHQVRDLTNQLQSSPNKRLKLLRPSDVTSAARVPRCSCAVHGKAETCGATRTRGTSSCPTCTGPDQTSAGN